ncbi:MAG: di-heme enzyme [Nannocystaceae bacterium]|nr:di-heme enzyme [Nannocystaceae bacterium]
MPKTAPLVWLVAVAACHGPTAASGDAAGDASSSSSSSAGSDDGSSGDAHGPDRVTHGEPGSGGESSSGGDAPPPQWQWSLPPGFPEPWVPPDNPMSTAKVELGRHLFYDTRLSVDGSYSCASCHQQALAFTDGHAHAQGVTGQQHPRSAMSLANVAYAGSLAWANPALLELEAHALGPLFGTTPIEQGLVDEADLLARIADEPRYDALFADAYPDEEKPRTLAHVAQAIAAFERTIISGRAPFDRWFFEGDESAISESAKRGWALFNFPGQCTYCHFNFDYSDSTYFASLPERTTPFHNTGLYDLDGAGAYPEGNEGLMRITGDPADMGKFKSPTLRNIAVTAPYMHDGSVATLQDVLDHYAAGGRAGGPLVDHRVKPFALKPDEVADFLAFFDSLTDEALLTDPALADPW